MDTCSVLRVGLVNLISKQVESGKSKTRVGLGVCLLIFGLVYGIYFLLSLSSKDSKEKALITSCFKMSGEAADKV